VKGLRQHGLMKGCVEYGHLRNIRQKFPHDFDTCYIRRIVQRRKRDELPDRFDRPVIDNRRLTEFLASVHHAVAHGKDLRCRSAGPGPAAHLQDNRKSFAVVSNRPCFDDLLPSAG